MNLRQDQSHLIYCLLLLVSAYTSLSAESIDVSLDGVEDSALEKHRALELRDTCVQVIVRHWDSGEYRMSTSTRLTGTTSRPNPPTEFGIRDSNRLVAAALKPPRRQDDCSPQLVTHYHTPPIDLES